MKTNDLKYYFNSEWLYQDITDKLRPRITLSTYADREDLKSKVKNYLAVHNVPEYDKDHILRELDNINIGEECGYFSQVFDILERGKSSQVQLNGTLLW